MNTPRIAVLGAALLALAACSKADDPGYQGWVEADLIFVSPDEAGRVETLSVREGDAWRRARRCSRSMPICSRPTSRWRRRR